jgi:hypothetical protein
MIFISSMPSLTRHVLLNSLIAGYGVLALAGCKTLTHAEKPRPATAVASVSATASVPVAKSPPLPANSLVMVYASPTTEAAAARKGNSVLPYAQQWQRFLRRYRIAGGITSDVTRIERMDAPVLVLPGASQLTAREMAAITAFRAGGGSVLATGETGVQDENGQVLGYGFMEKALGVGVAGTTEKDTNDTFLIPYGTSPVAHSLPAGQRLWLERAKDAYPLRLTGGHPAALIMDWSRSTLSTKPSTVIAFEERHTGKESSRAVVFGFSEKLWTSADPRAIESLAHNALFWLLRMPTASVAAWPHPYTSATFIAIDAADPLIEADLALPEAIAGPQARASYYFLSETASESSVLINRLRQTGHDVGVMGERFEGFKDQAAPVVEKRLHSAITAMQGAGISLDPGYGVHPVMESMDATTIAVMREHHTGYAIGGPEFSEARLPYFAAEKDLHSPSAMVVLPRTLTSPEDAIGEGDPKAGMEMFLRELELSHASGSLSIIRLLGQSMLDDAQMRTIRTAISAHGNRTWIATGRNVADWWRIRSQISASFDTTVTPPRLVVTLSRAMPSIRSPAVWVTLPQTGAKLTLSGGQGEPLPKVAAVDEWRAAILLDGLTPGTYQWQLGFSRPPP